MQSGLQHSQLILVVNHPMHARTYLAAAGKIEDELVVRRAGSRPNLFVLIAHINEIEHVCFVYPCVF